MESMLNLNNNTLFKCAATDNISEDTQRNKSGVVLTSCVGMQSKGQVRKTDFLSAIKPLLYVSKLIGIAPFRYLYPCAGNNSRDNTYIETSLCGILHSSVLILGLSCAFIPHIKFKITHIHVHYSYSFVIFDVVGSIFLFLASVVSLLQQAVLCREELKASLLTVVHIDSHLLRKSYASVYKKTNIILVLQLVISFAYLLTLFSFDFITLGEAFGWFHCFIRYVINIVDVVMSLQFVNFIFLIGHRFTVLNMELNHTITANPIHIEKYASDNEHKYSASVVELDFENAIRRETGISKMLPDGNVTDTHIFTNLWLRRHLRNQRVLNIRTLRRIHLLLHSIITTVNNSFGIQIMLTIISSATATTLNIHTSIVVLTKDLDTSVKDTMSTFLALNFAWTVPAILRLIVITASCEMSKKEAGRTAVLVQKLLLHRHLDPDVVEELQLFSQQLLHVNTNFTASGFFTLDFGFLYSTLGSVATFLVFLTQVWESYGQYSHANG